MIGRPPIQGGPEAVKSPGDDTATLAVWLRGECHDSFRCPNQPAIYNGTYKYLYHHCGVPSKLKPVEFLGTALKDLKSFPVEARRSTGFQLDKVQHGERSCPLTSVRPQYPVFSA